MKFLITTTEVYRCDDENEAQAFIEQLKRRGNDIVSSTIQKKERKVKGEIVDEWVRLTIKTNYNDEKEPESSYYANETADGYDIERGDINSEF